MKLFPIDPLARRIALKLGKEANRPFNDPSFDPRRHLTSRELAREIGCSDRTAVRYLSGRGLRKNRADKAAVRAGYHPMNVWPDFYDEERNAV